MKIMVRGCSGPALCTAIGPGAAQDQTTSSGPAAVSGPFIAWARIWGDTKGDGVHTCEEWKQYAARLFNQADRNHGGYLDAKEFESIRKADPILKDTEFAYFDDHRRAA